MRSVLGLLFLSTLVVTSAHARQSEAGRQTTRPDDHDGVLLLIGSRIGFLITGCESFTDRPLLQVDGGVQFGRTKVGKPPALAATVGIMGGAGGFLGEGSPVSMRVLGGIELPFAIDSSDSGTSTMELVPAIQVGYQRAFGEDRRSGFTLRAAVGLRLLPTSSSFYFTFEPVSLVLLPAPGTTEQKRTGRLAAELGLLKVGWRF